MQNSLICLLLLSLTSSLYHVTCFLSSHLDGGDFVNKGKGRYKQSQRIVNFLDVELFK